MENMYEMILHLQIFHFMLHIENTVFSISKIPMLKVICILKNNLSENIDI